MNSCILIKYNNQIIRLDIDYNNQFTSSNNLSGTVIKCNKLIACLNINGKFETFAYKPLSRIYEHIPGYNYNGNRVVNVYTGGGLGNQLWEYAFALYIANNIPNAGTICYNTTWFKNNIHVPREYHLEKFKLDSRIKKSDALQNYITLNNTIFESKMGNSTIADVLHNNIDLALSGYWQQWKYIKDYLPQIRDCFTLKEDITDETYLQYKCSITSTRSCSIHIRRTDYLNNQNFYAILDQTHYIRCIEYMKQLYPDVKFYCFSDDLDWCKQTFKGIGNITYVDNVKTDIHEFELMKLCSNNIIANSTFSWWAAILNSNPDKVVIAPKPWFTFKLNVFEFGCDGRCILL